MCSYEDRVETLTVYASNIFCESNTGNICTNKRRSSSSATFWLPSAQK